MSTGIDVFSRHFANYKEQYVVIGGTACEMLLSEEALDFRLTRDIDMVLIVEALTSEFATAFWEFIDKGGRGGGKPSMAQAGGTDPSGIEAALSKALEIVKNQII